MCQLMPHLRRIPMVYINLYDSLRFVVYRFNQLLASREAHKAQRVVQDQRRAAKPHSNIIVDAKRVWSMARQKNISTTERKKHIKELMDVIRGKVKDIVFKHDASRIVQTVVKYGGQKERDEIALELKGRYKELAENKYSKVDIFLFELLNVTDPFH